MEDDDKNDKNDNVEENVIDEGFEDVNILLMKVSNNSRYN